jgi:hypothetical protein
MDLDDTIRSGGHTSATSSVTQQKPGAQAL